MKILYIVALSLLTLNACSSAAQKDEKTEIRTEVSYLKVEAAEFKKAIEKEEDLQLIDVRTEGEYAAGTIEGAVNYDFLNGTFQEKLNTLDKNKPVYVFCAVGGRSGKASRLLEENGFTQIIDLVGGYNGWVKQ